MTENYLIFATDKNIKELLPVEALALINRWAKKKNYFYFDDLDYLYNIKDNLIIDWLKTGELIPTAIIIRESPVFQKIKIQIDNNCSDLDWLDFGQSYKNYLTEEESLNYALLSKLLEEVDDFPINYPEDIYQRWIEQLQPDIEKYQVAKKEYEWEFARRLPIVKEYEQQIKEYEQQKIEAAKNWAEENKIKIARSNSGKSLKKDWIKRLENQGFKFANPKPINPFPNKLKTPEIPKIPDKTYSINFQNYLPGSLPEIEKALNWAKTIIEVPYPLNEFDEDFFYCKFENALEKLVLERIKKEIKEIFEQIIKGELSNSKEIYDTLTQFEIDYEEAIGMQSYYNFSFYEKSHKDFGKWHKINLSKTGYWLVEFQSTINSNISFHLPYNKFSEKLIDINFKNIPKISTTQAKFGREINREEEKFYPLPKLLAILGFDPEDFPYQLEKYSPRTFYADWEEEEEEFDFE